MSNYSQLSYDELVELIKAGKRRGIVRQVLQITSGRRQRRPNLRFSDRALLKSDGIFARGVYTRHKLCAS